MQHDQERKSIPPAQFLTLSANLLYQALIKAPRTNAKRLYRDIEAGKVVPLTHVEMEDKSRVRFYLALNHTLYRGQLNFTTLRNAVALLISNAAETLKEPEKLRVFQNQNNPRSVAFGVVAVSSEAGTPNVLSLVADSSGQEAAVQLQLTYLDPEQFIAQATQPADANVAGGGDAV